MRIILRVNYLHLLKIAACLAGGGLLLVVSLGLYFYTSYSSRIDRALRDRPWDNFPAVWSAPGILFPGRLAGLDSLCRELDQRGYAVSTFLQKPPCYRYLPENRQLDILNDPGSFYVRPDARFARIILDGDRIIQIMNEQNRPLPSFLIQPAVLSSQRDGSRRVQIPPGGLPSNLRYAILAAEDQRFFQHPGLDPFAILRSFWVNLQEEEIRQGASTISQQLAKNIFLSPEKTFRRKFQEAWIALLLETKLSKEQLLEIYINNVYLGQTAAFSIFGFGEAAQVLCNKNLRNLSLAECAMLAGMIRSPNRYHPFRHADACQNRRNSVLEAMVASGYILPQERDRARQEPLPQLTTGLCEGLRAPYFLDYLTSLLSGPKSEGALIHGGRLHSTLNLEVQAAAEKALAKYSGWLEKAIAAKGTAPQPGQVPQAALVALDVKTGGILAMTGGTNYQLYPFNRATQSRRQAGSALKPLLYARLIEAGRLDPRLNLHAAAQTVDAPLTVQYGGRSYVPHNYNNRYHGMVTMKQALALSLNTATVRFCQRPGFAGLASFINQAGFSRRAHPYPSLCLGTLDVSPLELASVYTLFQNQGVIRPATPFAAAAAGRVPPGRPVQLVSAGAAFIVLDMMREAVERGTAANIRRLGIILPLAGKTGTARDGWFVGLTGNLAVCCWTGYDDNQEFPLSGGESALYLFSCLMNNLAGNYPVAPLPDEVPQGLTELRICSVSGQLAGANCTKTELDYFFPASRPLTPCRIHP